MERGEKEDVGVIFVESEGRVSGEHHGKSSRSQLLAFQEGVLRMPARHCKRQSSYDNIMVL